MVDTTLVTHNGNVAGSAGILANGVGTSMRVGSSSIAGNILGVSAVNGATLLSYGNNQLNGNNGGETITTTPLR